MTYPQNFQTVGIYGIGLLGGSVGLALKARYPSVHVVGMGRSPERLEKARQFGALDSFTTEPQSLPAMLDLLIVCTPVCVLPSHVTHALPAVKPDGVITDVGSTKAIVVEQCEAICGNAYRFVGSHPMAGSHKTGIEAAAADLYQDKICVVTETILSEPEAVDQVEVFWQALGMQVVRLNPVQHDRLVARSSHLPHMVAAALCHAVKDMGPAIFPVLGDGFRDTTRIAAGDSGMWTDICTDNRDEILASLDELSRIVEELKKKVENGDRDGIHEFLRQAQEWKTQQTK